jgi:hypothetical protein
VIPLVDELKSEPIVGKFYRVRCYINDSKPNLPFPIFGPEHDDKELLDFEKRHYHFDFRFAGKRMINYWRCQYHKPYSDDQVAQFMMIRVQLTEDRAGHIEVRKLRCVRRMPDFPLEVAHWLKPVLQNKLLPVLEYAFRDKRTTCATCPHRGFKLDQLPQKNGVVVCPGHGLAWNMASGEMVSRL